MKYIAKHILQISVYTIAAIVFFLPHNTFAQSSQITILNTMDTPSFGVGDAVGANSANVYGIRFITPNQSLTVSSLQIQDLYGNPITTGFDVDIYNTAIAKVFETAPVGPTIIGSFSDTRTANENGIATLLPTAPITLSPNTSYWLVLRTTGPTDFISLKISNITPSGIASVPVEGYRAFSSNGGTTYVYDENVNGGGSVGTGPWLPHIALFAVPTFSGEGAGTVPNPYVITTCEQLQEMNYDLDAHYVLGNNIDCSETQEWNPNTDEWVEGTVGGELIPDEYTGVINNGYFGFDPIGRTASGSNGFSGSLNGQGFSISNLWIFRNQQDYVGLIGYATNADINNITLINPRIVGSNYTGAFVGYADSVILENLTNQNGMVRAYLSYYGGGIAGAVENGSQVSGMDVDGGTVHGSGNIIGGLVGRIFDSQITNSFSSADVDGGEYIGGAFGIVISSSISSVIASGDVVSNDSEEVYLSGIIKSGNFTGGFAGEVVGSDIIESSASGNVTAQGNDVGGFIGSAFETAIEISSARGDVSGTNRVGGFLGYGNLNTISDAYAGGNVTGSGDMGGFAGEIFETSITNAYARGLVVSDSLSTSVGGFVGKIGDFTTINTSFWDTQSSEQENPCGDEVECAFLTPLTTQEATSIEPYQNAGWDFESIWALGLSNGGYPYFQFQPEDEEPEPEPEPDPEPRRRRSSGSMMSQSVSMSQFSSGQGTSESVATTPLPSLCAPDQILTQNLRSGARNGRYHWYTRDIVREANILQAHLNRLGFNSGPVDGILGPISDGAIRRMQAYLGTTVDGFVGPVTRGLLNNSCGSTGLQQS